jgi:hypothetical protein
MVKSSFLRLLLGNRRACKARYRMEATLFTFFKGDPHHCLRSKVEDVQGPGCLNFNPLVNQKLWVTKPMHHPTFSISYSWPQLSFLGRKYKLLCTFRLLTVPTSPLCSHWSLAAGLGRRLEQNINNIWAFATFLKSLHSPWRERWIRDQTPGICHSPILDE